MAKSFMGYETDGSEASELQLYIDNDEPQYRRKLAIRKNLLRHVCRGEFNKEQAAKGFSHLMDPASKAYNQELGKSKGHAFTPAARKIAAKEYVREFVRDVKNCRTGMCGDMTKEEETTLLSSKCRAGGELDDAKRRRR